MKIKRDTIYACTDSELIGNAKNITEHPNGYIYKGKRVTIQFHKKSIRFVKVISKLEINVKQSNVKI